MASFNPRPCARGDRDRITINQEGKMFQSTPLCEGRQLHHNLLLQTYLKLTSKQTADNYPYPRANNAPSVMPEHKKAGRLSPSLSKRDAISLPVSASDRQPEQSSSYHHPSIPHLIPFSEIPSPVPDKD